MKKILFIKKDENGDFWIHDNNVGILDQSIGPIGPYNSRAEAKEDAEGLTRTILSEPDIWDINSLVSKKRETKIDSSGENFNEGVETDS